MADALTGTWFTMSDSVARVGRKRLASLTNEKAEAAVIEIGAGGKTKFTTPFVWSTTLVALLDGVIQTSGVTFSYGTGPNEEDEMTFTPAPNGKQVSASTPNGILRDVLLAHVLDAEALVIAAMAGKDYVSPAFDEVPVAPYDLVLPKSWAWRLTEAALVKAVKRAPLPAAFAGIQESYFEIVGGPDLKKNPGILSRIDAPFVLNWPKVVTPETGSGAAIIANRRVFHEDPYSRDYDKVWTP